MSGTYIRSTVCDAQMEQKMCSLARQRDSTDTLGSVLLRPPPTSPHLIPKIRILLAPYMSPYVVPVQQVKTWESLHETLRSLFGGLCNGALLRITDHKGAVIIPAKWRTLLRPNMTFIVDTYPYTREKGEATVELSKSAPTTTGTGFGSFTTNGLDDNVKKSYHQRSRTQDRNPTMAELREREGGNDPYGSQGYLHEPEVEIPHGSLKHRPVQAWDGWTDDTTSMDGKRRTTVTLFTESHHEEDDKLHNGGGVVEVETHLRVDTRRMGPGSEFAPIQYMPTPIKTADFRVSTESTRAAKEQYREEFHAVKPPRKEKTSWSRLGKALRFVIKAGNATKQQDKEKPPPPFHQHTEPRIPQTLPRPHTRNKSLSERRGVPAPPPLNARPSEHNVYKAVSVDIKRNRRRSKSLSSLPLAEAKCEAVPAATASTPGLRSRFGTLNRKGTKKEGLSTIKRKQAQQATISPPVPRRPVEELGINAQFKQPGMDKAQIQEIVGDQSLDGSTLGGSFRSGFSPNSESTAVELDKPLPKLPNTLSVFPPRSPSRSPSAKHSKRFEVSPQGSTRLPLADRRPATMAPPSSRKVPVPIRRYASERR